MKLSHLSLMLGSLYSEMQVLLAQHSINLGAITPFNNALEELFRNILLPLLFDDCVVFLIPSHNVMLVSPQPPPNRHWHRRQSLPRLIFLP